MKTALLLICGAAIYAVMSHLIQEVREMLKPEYDFIDECDRD